MPYYRSLNGGYLAFTQILYKVCGLNMIVTICGFNDWMLNDWRSKVACNQRCVVYIGIATTSTCLLVCSNMGFIEIMIFAYKLIDTKKWNQTFALHYISYVLMFLCSYFLAVFNDIIIIIIIKITIQCKIMKWMKWNQCCC